MQQNLDAKTIEKMVYERYPVTKEEMSCARERDKRDYLRSQYKKELKKGFVSKKHYE
jgi:hypothetical protein